MMKRVRLFGFDFASGSVDQIVQEITDLITVRRARVITPVNVDITVRLLREPVDEELRAACSESDLIIPDGMPIVWASHLLGTPLASRVTGLDLMVALCAAAAKSGRSVFCLGAAPGVAQRAATALTALYPNLRIAGTYAPPLGFERSPIENARVLKAASMHAPDLLFVAFGVPKQEKWIRRWRTELSAGGILSVGGSFDMLAGDRRRAPLWMRDHGFEWLWRLALEPARLWRRYLVDDVAFARYLWREWRQRSKPS